MDFKARVYRGGKRPSVNVIGLSCSYATGLHIIEDGTKGYRKPQAEGLADGNPER